MASLKLLAGLAGLTQGLTEVKEKKDEETKQLIAARTKTAYQNYLKHQEQVAALKEEVKKRDAEALQFQQDLTDDERIALATMPNALELYRQAIKDGQRNPETGAVVSLRDVLKVGDKAKGMKYADFVSSLTAAPQAGPVTFQPQEGLFGASAEKQRRMMQTTAGTVGMTPEALMAYERPVAVPELTPMGSLDVERLFAKEKQPQKQLSSPERLESFKSTYLDKKMEFGEDHPDTRAALLKYDTELVNQRVMDDDQQRHNRNVNEAKLAVSEAALKYGANSTQHKKAIDTLNAVEGKAKEDPNKLPTPNGLRVLFNDHINNALSKYGGEKGIAYEQTTKLDAQGNQIQVSVPVWTGNPTSDIYARMRQSAITAIEYMYKSGGLSKADGTPVNDDVKRELIANGITFDDRNRPIFSTATVLPARGGAGVGQETPALPARNNVTTTPTAPTAAQPSPVAPQGAPAARPGATAPTAAIPQGAIDMLKKNPKLAPDFDEKYGPGSAARILGSR